MAKSVSSRPCYNTGKGNFFIIDVLNDRGEPEEHEVYFKVSRKQKGVLKLFVESSYRRDDEHGSRQPAKKKTGFFVIAHNTQRNKEIKVPK